MPVSSPEPAGGVSRTLIVRLRREPNVSAWRGQAVCVQTGATCPLCLLGADDDVAQLAAALLRLLAAPSEASQTD